jgi:hypothetical protein
MAVSRTHQLTTDGYTKWQYAHCCLGFTQTAHEDWSKFLQGGLEGEEPLSADQLHLTELNLLEPTPFLGDEIHCKYFNQLLAPDNKDQVREQTSTYLNGTGRGQG